MATTETAAHAYEALAPHYDNFVAASDYEAFVSQLEPVLLEHGLRGRSLLDLACGTGNSFLPFLRRGYRVTGCDISPAMLARARAKGPEAGLFAADVRALRAVGDFALVTCLDDSLNYLLEPDDLAAAFRSAAANLAPGGLFAFDLNTLLAYRTTFAAESISAGDGLVFLWKGDSSPDAAPGCLASATLEAFSLADGGLYERTESRHLQRHHPRDRVRAALEDAGLELVAGHGLRDDGSLAPVPDEHALLKTVYLARRIEGTDPWPRPEGR
jgi:SAM-dependent methyltransferase